MLHFWKRQDIFIQVLYICVFCQLIYSCWINFVVKRSEEAWCKSFLRALLVTSESPKLIIVGGNPIPYHHNVGSGQVDFIPKNWYVSLFEH